MNLRLKVLLIMGRYRMMQSCILLGIIGLVRKSRRVDLDWFLDMLMNINNNKMIMRHSNIMILIIIAAIVAIMIEDKID